MKYILGVLVTFLCTVSVTKAQYVDSLWQVESNAKRMYAMPLFHNRFIDDIKGNMSQTPENMYTLSWVSDSILEVSYTKPSQLTTWPAIHFNTVNWQGDTTNKFTKNLLGESVKHQIASGYTVNMSPKSQRQISFYVQANESLVLLGTLMDIQGKNSNSVEAKVTIDKTIGGVDINDEAKWVKVNMSWDASIITTGDNGSMQDDYSDTWHNRSNLGNRNNIHNIDSLNISTLCLYADPAGFGTVDLNKTIYIRDLQMGSFEYDLVWQVDNETVKMQEIALLDESTKNIPLIISDSEQYTSNIIQDYFEINFTNNSTQNVTSGSEIYLSRFTENIYVPFKTDLIGVPVSHDTLIGYSVDFSEKENRIMHFQVQSDSDLDLITNLIDVNSKHSNHASPKLTILKTPGGIDAADNSKWKTYTIAWNTSVLANSFVTTMIDSLQTEWWGMPINGNRNELHNLDSSSICGFEFIIDPNTEDEIGKKKTLLIRKPVLGSKVFYDISNYNLDFDNQLVSIDLKTYYHGGFTPNFTANSANQEIAYTIENGVLILEAKELCYDYTQLVDISCSDINGSYNQTISISFTTHKLEAPHIKGVSTTDAGISVSWDDDNSRFIEKYTIYRKDVDSDFISIEESSNSNFNILDITANYKTVQYRYYIVATDVCNKESVNSATHGSILLEYIKEDSLTHLSWNAYLGAPVFAYNIYASNTKGDIVLLKELSSLEKTYTVKKDSSYNFYIEAILEGGEYSLSNIIDVPTKVELPSYNTVVYPTVFKNKLTIQYKDDNLVAKLLDAEGKIVLETYSGEINTADVKSGFYTLLLYSKGRIVSSTKLIKK